MKRRRYQGCLGTERGHENIATQWVSTSQGEGPQERLTVRAPWHWIRASRTVRNKRLLSSPPGCGTVMPARADWDRPQRCPQLPPCPHVESEKLARTFTQLVGGSHENSHYFQWHGDGLKSSTLAEGNNKRYCKVLQFLCEAEKSTAELSTSSFSINLNDTWKVHGDIWRWKIFFFGTIFPVVFGVRL